jgi:hypothetical protein
VLIDRGGRNAGDLCQLLKNEDGCLSRASKIASSIMVVGDSEAITRKFLCRISLMIVASATAFEPSTATSFVVNLPSRKSFHGEKYAD